MTDLSEGEDAREERVLSDLRRRATFEMLTRDVAPELGLNDDVVRRCARHAEHARIFARLACERCRRGKLAAFFGRVQRVFEILEREVFQVVFAENANAVHEAFEHVLEHPAFTADLDEHLEAIECALALTDALEVVRRFFEEAHGSDVRLARLASIAAFLRAAREVELHERRVVSVGAAANHLREPRPERPRAAPIVGFLPVDRSGSDEASVLHFTRRAGHVVRRRERAGAIDGRHVGQHRGRALPSVGLGRRHVPVDGERAPRIVATKKHFDERTEHAHVIVLGDVRLLRRRDERVRCVIEVSPLHRDARALAQMEEIVEHPFAV
jgi:hypothetical protein